MCDPPVLPRQRRLPRLVDDGTPQYVYNSIEEFYKKEYFQAIDNIIGVLENRFKQESFLLVRKVKHLLVESANGKEVLIPQKVCTIY